MSWSDDALAHVRSVVAANVRIHDLVQTSRKLERANRRLVRRQQRLMQNRSRASQQTSTAPSGTGRGLRLRSRRTRA
jgi:hypothetical protein